MKSIPNNIKFAAGAEFECKIVAKDDTAALNKYLGQGSKRLRFDNPRLLPFAPSVEQEIEETKDAARRQQEELLKFTPKNLYEQNVYNTWLATDVDTWGAAECINYMLYEDTQPSLGKLSLPRGASYDQTIASSHSNLFEYRFGTGSHQTGYYDFSGMLDGKHETVTELRLNPVSLDELLWKQHFATQRIAAAAMYFGQEVFLLGTHYTISCFRGERPVFGDMQENILPYKAALGGLLQTNREQALVHSGTLLEKRPHRFFASPWRDSVVRISPNKLEYRAASQPGTASDAMALRFMKAGLLHAVAHPEIAQDEGITETEIITAKITKHFKADRSPDIELVRAVESCRLAPTTNSLELSRNLEAEDIPKFLRGFLGRLPNLAGRENSHLLVNATADFLQSCIVRRSENGHLTLHQSNFLAAMLQGRFDILDIHINDLNAITQQLEKITVSTNRKALVGEVLHGAMTIDEVIRNASNATILPHVDPNGHQEHLEELQILKSRLPKD